MLKFYITGAAVAVLAVAASAQNYNAFKDVTLNGVTVTQSGDTFTVSLDSDPTVSRVVGNGKVKSSPITDITGFWLLGASGNVAAVQNSVSGYKLDTNTGGGTSAYGWSTQNKNGLTAGQSATFTVSSLNQSALSSFGFSLKASGIPDHIQSPKQATPEPASLLILGFGGIALLRKRKRS